jgi:hypothetical protein
MFCRVFYYLSTDDEEVPSSRPADLPPGQVWSDLVACLKAADDYVGLIDAADNVLQIMLDEEAHGYWVELPIADEHASYGRRMSAAEVKALLAKLPGSFRRRNFPDFRRRPW